MGGDGRTGIQIGIRGILIRETANQVAGPFPPLPMCMQVDVGGWSIFFPISKGMLFFVNTILIRKGHAVKYRY